LRISEPYPLQATDLGLPRVSFLFILSKPSL
jgi:hypothetical protein